MSLYRRIVAGVVGLFIVTVTLGTLLQGDMLARYHEIARSGETVAALTAVRDHLGTAYREAPATTRPRLAELSDRVGKTMLRLEEMDMLREQLVLRLVASNMAVPLVVMISALALVLAMVRSLLKPLMQLTEAMRRHAAGEPAVFPLPAAGIPEVRLLTAATNGMMRTIAGQHEILAQQSRVLGWRNAAREVVHEMRNIMTPARLAAEGLAEQAAGRGDASLVRQGARVLESLNAMERLAAALKDVAAMRMPQPVPVSLHSMAEAAARRHAGGPLSVVTGGIPVDGRADADLIASALDNLIINAREAGASRLVITTGRDDAGHGYIECADDGPGFPPGLAERAFRINVTTKPGGSGFGLYLVHKIMEEQGGAVAWGPGLDGRGAAIRMVFNGNHTDRR